MVGNIYLVDFDETLIKNDLKDPNYFNKFNPIQKNESLLTYLRNSTDSFFILTGRNLQFRNPISQYLKIEEESVYCRPWSFDFKNKSITEYLEQLYAWKISIIQNFLNDKHFVIFIDDRAKDMLKRYPEIFKNPNFLCFDPIW